VLWAKLMRRRKFIKIIVGTVAAWPLASRAQQRTMPVIRFLHGGSADPNSNGPLVKPFREGLAQFGYLEGRNLAIEFRWAEGHYDRLADLAADLVRRQVAVIAAFSPPAVQAAQAATTVIPIVFESGNDPIKAGLIVSFNRPGGNATGINILVEELLGKRLGLLHDLMPTASTIAVILNSQTPAYQTQSIDIQAAAQKLGTEIRILNASTEQDVDRAFSDIVQMRAGALLVGSDPFLATCVEQMVGLAARYSIPAIYARHEFVRAGGLMSYDIDFPGAYRQSGIYVGRILKGEKPSELPVVRPTKFELVINLKTAKTLGLTVPTGMLAIADEVIE
jgi:putative tryptophan/tyrosine transport system substrate-binding protein